MSITIEDINGIIEQLIVKCELEEDMNPDGSFDSYVFFSCHDSILKAFAGLRPTDMSMNAFHGEIIGLINADYDWFKQLEAAKPADPNGLSAHLALSENGSMRLQRLALDSVMARVVLQVQHLRQPA